MIARHQMLRITCIVVSLALAVSFSSCCRKRTPEELLAGPTEKELAAGLRAGGELYDQYCAPCHGVTGKGDGRYVASSIEPQPSDLTENRSDMLPANQLASWIRDGSTAFGRSNLCPAWRRTLASNDIHSLTQVVRSMRKKTSERKGARQ